MEHLYAAANEAELKRLRAMSEPLLCTLEVYLAYLQSERFSKDGTGESGIWFEEGMAEYVSRRYFSLRRRGYGVRTVPGRSCF